MPIKDLAKRKEDWKAYNIRKRDYVNGLSAKWRKDNPEKAKKIQQGYRDRNTDKVKKARKKWAIENPEKQKAAVKNWSRLNNGKIREYSRMRRNAKFEATGEHTTGEWELLKKQYGYTCPSCKRI